MKKLQNGNDGVNQHAPKKEIDVEQVRKELEKEMKKYRKEKQALHI